MAQQRAAYSDSAINGGRDADSKRLTGKTDRSRLANQETFFENRVESEWLTTREAARYLGVSTNALRIMVFREKLRAYKLGSRLRFLVGDLRSVLTKKWED